MRRTASLLVSAILLWAGQATAADDVLKIGIAAMISPLETYKYYSSLVDFVGEKLGRSVEVRQKENYDEMDGMLERNEVAMAFICAGPYVKDKDKFGVELLVAPQSYGKSVYYAYIIVPLDSPIKTFEDLRGKKFAFTDPKSNTGKLVPTFMIAKRFKQTPDTFFKETIYTKSHDRSIEAVAKKLVDGAAVDSLIYDYATRKNPVFATNTRILEKSPPYGIPPIVVTKATPAELKEKVREILLHMHENPRGKAILDAIMVEKFIVPKDSDYDSVREMVAWVEKMK